MDNRYLFIGGDRRIIYAAKALAQRHSVAALGLSENMPNAEGKYRNIVLPLPFSREEGFLNAPLSSQRLPLSLISDYADEGATVFSGGTSPLLHELCREKGLTLIDYFAYEPLTIINAALTAEAAVSLLIQNTEYSLDSAAVIITGGGRIAQMSARLLKVFGADVTICARSAEQRARARAEHCRTAGIAELSALSEKADIIVNTVPSSLFLPQDFRRMKAGALFMELATRRPSPEKGYAEQYGIRFVDAAGLPGAYSPKTAGEAIADAILSARG